MADQFVDTSALLKVYIPEVGSAWMTEQLAGNASCISSLTIVEIGASLSRRMHAGTMSAQLARRVWQHFRRDVRAFLLMPLERRSLERAANLTGRLPMLLRTLDAIQLQNAIEFSGALRARGEPPPVFISADPRLLDTAAALGFQTEDPNDHP